MPSFDVVSRIEMHEVENAVNNTRKEIAGRFDFRGAHVEITLDPKARKLHIVAPDKMKIEAVRESLLNHAAKRKLDIKSLKFEDPVPGAGASLKRDVVIREGIDQDTAKKIVKLIKDSKLKVQASIQGDEVRVNGKKIDDLQSVIALLRAAKEIDLPLQFVNMKS